MRVIIAGGREFDNWETVKRNCDYFLSERKESYVEIVSGRCPVGTLTFETNDGTKVYGADGLGEKYAALRGFPVVPFPIIRKYGFKRGAYMRNKQMAEYGTHGIFFWDGKSDGTKMMIDLAKQHNLKLRIVRYA